MLRSISVNQEKIYKLICFLFSFATTTVFTINILYQMQVAKLSPLQLVLVGTCLEATCFLFEIPTGIIADRFSRKLSIIIGFALIGCGFILEGSVPVFIFIAIAQIIWGIGYTCISGALDAWVIDETGKDTLFISGAKNASIGQFLGILVSVALAQITLNLPIVFGGIVLIALSILLILFMTERPYNKVMEKNEKNYFVNIFESIYKTVKTNHTLAILFIIALFLGLYSEGFDRLWGTLILNTEEFTDSNGIYVFGAIAAITAIIGFLTFNKIEAKAEKTNINIINNILIYICLVIIIGLCLMTFIKNGYILVLLVIIINLSRSIIEPFETIWFNNLITDSNNRATILSLKGQVGALGQISSGPLMGIFSIFMPLRFIFILSAIIFSPTVLLFIYIKNKVQK